MGCPFWNACVHVRERDTEEKTRKEERERGGGEGGEGKYVCMCEGGRERVGITGVRKRSHPALLLEIVRLDVLLFRERTGLTSHFGLCEQVRPKGRTPRRCHLHSACN